MSPIVKTMSRMGMLRVTAVMTLASALLSVLVAWLIALLVPIPDRDVHLLLAFVIPFFVTPGFSYLTALAMRESRRARKLAVEQARLDPLTGVLNRRAFFEWDERSREELATARLDRTVLFLDIDHFKRINDTYGHEGGDAVLKHIAGVMTASVRKGDIVARFGGEEFVIVAPDCDRAGACVLVGRIMDAIRASTVPFVSREIAYTVSMGIASGEATAPIARLLADADAQLYIAKQTGRDRACFAERSDLTAKLRDDDADAATGAHVRTGALVPATQ